jgi:hypothetical protein
MRPNRVKGHALSLLLMLYLIVPLSADFNGTWDFNIDWTESLMEWEILYTLPSGSALLPSTRRDMEREISRHFTSIFIEALLPLIIDSSTSIRTSIEKNPGLRSDLAALSGEAQRTYSHYTPDFRQWRCTYKMALYPAIADLFLSHEKSFLPDLRISMEPTARYTGILIYVEEQLPVHGLFTSAPLKPALFPKVVDQEMKRIIDRNMMDPDIVRNRGMFLLLPPEKIDAAASRVGTTPLRITAGALFGINHTDIVISNRAAQQILSNENNRDLIRQGKVALISEAF